MQFNRSKISKRNLQIFQLSSKYLKNDFDMQ